MSAAASSLIHSIHTRLIRHAKSLGADPSLVFTRFATERFLCRLSRSRHADRFVLKGALLLLDRFGETFRPTRDADPLGFEDLSEEALAAILSEICGIEVGPDGVTFEIPSIRLSTKVGGRPRGIARPLRVYPRPITSSLIFFNPSAASRA